MKIAIACAKSVENPYVSQLVHGLEAHPEVGEVIQNLSYFWKGDAEADIVHIQWPEALFRWREPSEKDLFLLAEKLKQWRSKSTLVATVHNIAPHGQNSIYFKSLYDLIYSSVDGVIHLGKASKRECDLRLQSCSGKLNTVIPHGDYSCFPDGITMGGARSWLRLDSDDFVCLAFGAIRNLNEFKLIVKGFEAFDHPRKKLIVAGRIPWPQKRSLDWLYIKYCIARYNILLKEGWIPHERVQIYLNAADVVIIPRIDSLNSGNVALGFTFGKVVCGPQIGVMGEQLMSSGNPVFSPPSPSSLAQALKKAVELVSQGQGELNRELARREWNWRKVSDKHLKFYQLCASRSPV